MIEMRPQDTGIDTGTDGQMNFLTRVKKKNLNKSATLVSVRLSYGK